MAATGQVKGNLNEDLSREITEATGSFTSYNKGTLAPGSHIRIPVPSRSYPLELKSGPTLIPFIHLNIVDAVASAPRTNYAIGLYMPTSIKIPYHANWDEIPMGFSGEFAKEILDANSAGEVWGSAKGAALEAARTGAQQIGNMSGLNVGAKAEVLSRSMVNPHTAIQFKGMGLREFQMDFTFFPKSHTESLELREIIFQLKWAMHPGLTGSGGGLGRYWKYPNNFIIGFYGPNQKSIVKTSPCALIDMVVEYNGAGVPAFFAQDHRPVCIQMTLHFKECEALTRERIEQGW